MVSGFQAVAFNFNVLCSLSLILYATAIVYVCFANCAPSNPRTLEPAPLVAQVTFDRLPFSPISISSSKSQLSVILRGAFLFSDIFEYQVLFP